MAAALVPSEEVGADLGFDEESGVVVPSQEGESGVVAAKVGDCGLGDQRSEDQRVPSKSVFEEI